ncbi:MAG TPA: hypothetical protein VMZ29_15865 [Candidatus Bathyarchaeia archaeon]|nr:hypothetical protein [Candidatus Bathyarchaeia archaeon]
MVENKAVHEWLIGTNPWTEYNTRINLLGQKKDEPEVLEAKREMLAHPLVINLLQDINKWPWCGLKRHNDANHPLHKLVFLADLGLTREEKAIATVGEKIFRCQSDEGAFQLPIQIPKAFGGNDQEQLTWMLCDTPSLLYTLIKFGWEKDSRVKKALRHLAGLQQENGWLCTVSPTLGKFRGPGRKDDPCPYATLISLKALITHPEYYKSKISIKGAEVLLTLWEQRKERKPYLFGMGTDFCKLKAPYIWYDILHIASVLTQLDWLKKDERVNDMMDIIRVKANEQKLFTAESIWNAWKEWDFGQKKIPSPWITYLFYLTEKGII